MFPASAAILDRIPSNFHRPHNFHRNKPIGVVVGRVAIQFRSVWTCPSIMWSDQSEYGLSGAVDRCGPGVALKLQEIPPTADASPAEERDRKSGRTAFWAGGSVPNRPRSRAFVSLAVLVANFSYRFFCRPIRKFHWYYFHLPPL